MKTFDIGEHFLQKLRSIASEALRSTNVELELRVFALSATGDIVYSVDPQFWHKLKRRLDAQFSNDNKVSSNSKVYIKTSASSTVLRKVIDAKDGTEVYERKVKDMNHVLDMKIVSSINAAYNDRSVDVITKTPIRVALAKEEQVFASEYNSLIATEAVRSRERFSYFSPRSNVRIDLTVIQSVPNKIEYSVEIEVVKFASSPDGVIRQLLDGLSFVYPVLHTLYTPEVYEEKYARLFVQRGFAPINIQAQHIAATGLNNYYVTNKLDGVAYSLFLVPSASNASVSLVLKNNTDCWLLKTNEIQLSQDVIKQIFNFINVQIRVEVLEHTKPLENNVRYTLHMFDIVRGNNNEVIEMFSKRIHLMSLIHPLLKKLIAPPFNVFLKSFNKLDNVEADLKNALYHGEFPSMTDGIIFQPEHAMTTSALKWKQSDKISVDFLFVKDPRKSTPVETVYVLKVLDTSDKSDKVKYVQFPMMKAKKSDLTSRVLLPSTQVNDLLLKSDETLAPKRISYRNHNVKDNVPASDLDGLIIECAGKVTPKEITKGTERVVEHQLDFRILRIRWDKNMPNSLKTAEETCVDMVYERNLFALTQEIVEARKKSSSDSSLQRVSSQSYYNNRTDVVLSNVPSHVLQRYFPYSEMIHEQRVTEQGLKVMVDVAEATSVTAKLKGMFDSASIIVDAFAGLGGSTLGFGTLANTVTIAIESNKVVFGALEHNLALYRSRMPGKMVAANESFFDDILPQICEYYGKIDIVYMDPPIAGDDFHVSKMRGLIEFALKYAKAVVLRWCRSQPVPAELFQAFDYASLSLSAASKHYVFTSKGYGMDKLREQNNLMKNAIINKYTRGQHVLDLGSGKGGDLTKYLKANVASLVCVEPNQDNLVELNKRIQQDERLSKHPIEVVEADVESFGCKREFDVVSLFYALTFFFKSEELLDVLVRKIDESLHEAGVFIGTSVIGTNLVFPLSTQTFTFELVEASNSVFGNKVVFDMYGSKTATKQFEYLVDFNVFSQKLADRKIFLAETFYVQDTTGFSPDELLLSKNNLGFVFVKNNFVIANEVPIAVGTEASNSSESLWRLPNPVFHENSFYNVLQQAESNLAKVADFVYRCRPYEDVAMDDDVGAVRSSLVMEFSLEKYLRSKLSVLDLSRILQDEEHTEFHNFSDAFFEVLNDDQVVSIDDLARLLNEQGNERDLDLLSIVASFMYNNACLVLKSDAMGSYVLELVATVLNVTICVYDVHDMRWVFTYSPSRHSPVLRVSLIQSTHFELMCSSTGEV